MWVLPDAGFITLGEEMARERKISAEIWKDPVFAKLPALTRLFYLGIWSEADFDGVFPWEPEALGMKLLPKEHFDEVQALADLEASGFLGAYTVEGIRYGYVKEWHKNQDPHPEEHPQHPKPVNPDDAQGMMVRVVRDKYRSKATKKCFEATAYGRSDIKEGVYSLAEIKQLVDNLPTTSQQPPSKASPSSPSSPSDPSGPSKRIDEIGCQGGSIHPIHPSATHTSSKAQGPAAHPSIKDILDKWNKIASMKGLNLKRTLNLEEQDIVNKNIEAGTYSWFDLEYACYYVLKNNWPSENGYKPNLVSFFKNSNGVTIEYASKGRCLWEELHPGSTCPGEIVPDTEEEDVREGESGKAAQRFAKFVPNPSVAARLRESSKAASATPPRTGESGNASSATPPRIGTGGNAASATMTREISKPWPKRRRRDGVNEYQDPRTGKWGPFKNEEEADEAAALDPAQD